MPGDSGWGILRNLLSAADSGRVVLERGARLGGGAGKILRSCLHYFIHQTPTHCSRAVSLWLRLFTKGSAAVGAGRMSMMAGR